MAIRHTVDFSQVEEELISRLGDLGIEVVLDENETKVLKSKDDNESEDNQDSGNENGDDE